jgi:hypothetical protein
MKPIRTDSPQSCCAHGRWLAVALLAGLVTLALSACSKQPEPDRDGGPKPAPQGGDKGAAGNGGPKATPQDKEKAADEKRRQQSANNLNRIVLGLHAFHDTYKKLPPGAICDKKTGKPLLSWRVAILPFLEQEPVYRLFKLDEPWDSPHNKKLLEHLPPVYAPPGARSAAPYLTFYRGFVAAPGSARAQQTAWQTLPAMNSPFGAWGDRITAIRDGTSNTIGVVEAAEAVPWTKPDELVYDENKPLPKLGGLFKDGFHAARMDGSVHFYSNRIEESTLRALITASGGEVVMLAALEKEGLIKSPRPLRQDDDKGPAVDEEPKGKEKVVLGPREQQSVNNLKQLMLALHSFHDANRQLPPAAICDKKTGKPLLSWRVAILPYIEQGNLYKQFNLDEPWDGPNNKKLAEIVVPTYAPPGAAAGEAHKTYYRGFVAPPVGQFRTAWQTNPTKNPPFGALGTRLTDITDGTSNTIGVIEAGEAVPWTKPDELPYDPKGPLPKLGGLFKDGFHAAMMDGKVVFISRQIDENSLRALITASGGEVIDMDGLRQKGLIK